MSIGMRIVTGLLAMLALTGIASAQNAPCPECDADGDANPENTYSSIDLGLVGNDTEVLGDTDWAVSHSDDEKGFWAWLSLCVGVFLQHVEETLGVKADADANVEAYVSQDGVDLDATVYAPGEACAAVPAEAAEALVALGDDGSCSFGFDRGAAGDADGQTWVMVGEADAQLGGIPTAPFPGEHVPALDQDVCVDAELVLGTCA